MQLIPTDKTHINLVVIDPIDSRNLRLQDTRFTDVAVETRELLRNLNRKVNK